MMEMLLYAFEVHAVHTGPGLKWAFLLVLPRSWAMAANLRVVGLQDGEG